MNRISEDTVGEGPAVSESEMIRPLFGACTYVDLGAVRNAHSCPECGELMVFQCGCHFCPICGYSPCD